MFKTLVMGIVNATSDSFYPPSRFYDPEEAVRYALKLAGEGADILDIGGESTRPGSEGVALDEELRHAVPIIKELKKSISIPISIDTRKPEVAAAAVEAGAALINDVEGFQNPQMQEIASSSGVQICVMHMRGTPETMQRDPFYEEGIIPHLERWFEERINMLLKSGIKETQIILDPGVGFGKTIADNFKILQNLHRLKAIGFPLLLGISRKSFMGKSSTERLPGTLALNSLAINEKVDIIRVHDVSEHRAVVDLLHQANSY